jgi:hypothetical protein
MSESGLRELIIACKRFGLLHRIPPQPVDRLPGTIPIELQQTTEEYEEQDLFVPADVHEPHFSPEQLANWRRQEQEQWHQETLAAQSLHEPPQARVNPSSREHEAELRHSHHPHYNENRDHGHGHHSDRRSHSGDGRTSHRSTRAFDGSLTPTRLTAGLFMNGDSSSR